MNRLLLTLRNSHNNHSHSHPHSHPDNSQLQSISNRLFFKFYKQGVALSSNNKLVQANAAFQKSLQEIKTSKQDVLEHFSYILRKMAYNHRRLGQNLQAQQRLYEIIKHKRANQVVSALIYDDYNTLFKHMITYDLQKASKLCRALLTRQKDQMPISHVKLFNMNLGMTYLLDGNYHDAKKRFSKCLQANPQGKLKTYALNNFALACWWHKNPLQQTVEQQNKDLKVDKQFDQAKDLFCKALSEAEKASDTLNPHNKLLLQQALTLKMQKLNNNVQFNSPESIIPLFNLAQFFIYNDPIQKAQILFWYSKAMTQSKKFKKQKYFDYVYVKQLLLTSKIVELQKIMPSMIQKYRYHQQFIEQSFYCKVYAKTLQISRQNEKAVQYIKRFEVLESVLPKWSSKLKYLAYDELELVN